MLIGLSGWGGAGKDTVGHKLAEQHGFKTTAFADPMRAAALALNPIVGFYDFEHFTRYSDALEAVGYERAKQNPEIRAFLQRVGTEMGRKLFGEDFWTEQTFRIIAKSSNASWAITDVRFRNEAQAVKDHGGVVVRVTRPGVTPANDHVSEHDLDDWEFDYHIRNGLGIDDLDEPVHHLVVSVAADLLVRHSA